MADPELICGRLIHAVREGSLETVRELINSYGLSYSQEWLGGYVLLCDALKNEHTEIAKLLLTSGSKVYSENVEPSNTPLHLAAINGEIEIFQMILDKGAKIDAINEDGRTPLHCAIESKNMEVIELLLNHGADINCAYANPWSSRGALHFAAQGRSREIITLLLNKGADVNVTGGDHITPLHIAAEIGDEDIVRCLLSYEPCIDSLTLEEGLTPLHSAIRAGHHTVVQVLLQNGANVDIQDNDGNTILHHAVQTGNAIIVKEVLKYRPDINNTSNRRSLITAVLGYGEERKKTFALIAFLGHGIAINQEDASNSMLLHVAKEYFTIVQELLKYGADVNVRGEYGETPLVCAIKYNDLEMTKLLLTNGAHVNTEVLNAAVIKGRIDIVEAALECDVDINAMDEDGITALHRAILYYHKDIVKALLGRGANIDSKDNDGCTPLYFGAAMGHQEAVETLLKLGANVNSRDNSGGTALHFASGRGRTEVVITLLKYGADINITDFDNQTPISLAIQCRNLDPIIGLAIGRRNLEPIVDALKCHIVKMKAANLYVSKENLQSVIYDGEITDFQNKCEVEIANMESEKIDSTTNITFHDILTKDTNALAKCMGNENIVSALESDEYKATFPIYAGMIERNIRQGMEQQELLQQCNKVLHNLFPVLPDVCIDKILSYLSNNDLRVLTH